MTELDRDFEDKLEAALIDEAEDKLDQIAQDLVDIAERNWRDYASRNDYDVEHIWQDVESPEVYRDAEGAHAVIEWPGLTALFEFGVDPHTIEGNPLLAFYWNSPPEGTRPEGAPSFVVSESVNWGSVTGGIPASRAIRDAIDETRGDLTRGDFA